MSLSDIMGHADLSFYPIVALVLFLIAFSAIVLYLFARRNQKTFEQAKQLPLADGVLIPREAGETLLSRGGGHE